MPGALLQAEIRHVRRCPPRYLIIPPARLTSLKLILDVQGLALDSRKTHSWHIERCSAWAGLTLSKGFDWLIRDVSHRLYFAVDADKPAEASAATAEA